MPKRKPYRHALAMVGGNGLLKSLFRTFEVVRERWIEIEAKVEAKPRYIRYTVGGRADAIDAISRQVLY